MKSETGDLLHWGFVRKQEGEPTPACGHPSPEGNGREREPIPTCGHPSRGGDLGYGKALRWKLDRMLLALRNTRILHWKDLQGMFGWEARTCRAIAEASKGRIVSFDGGYVLNELATPAEFAQANGRIRNQADKMHLRATLEKEVREELCGVGS